MTNYVAEVGHYIFETPLYVGLTKIEKLVILLSYDTLG